MKAHATLMFVAAFAATAAWGQSANKLEPIYASAPTGSECAPPNDHMGQACDAFNGLIRANFTPREISALFGAWTAHAGYLSGNVEALQKRYEAVVRRYDVAQRQASAAKIAAQ